MTDRVAIALTLYGEARGEALEGRVAVASVLRNRLALKRWGTSYAAVCLADRQFSCWNASDPNAPLLRALAAELEGQQVAPDAMVRECLWLADGLIANAFASRVGPATHYHATWMPTAPRWVAGALQTAVVGRHRFFANVR